MTLQDRMQAALIRRGWTTDYTALTERYLVMKPTRGAEPPWRDSAKARLYLGPAGALRISTEGSIRSSVPWEWLKKQLLTEENDMDSVTYRGYNIRRNGEQFEVWLRDARDTDQLFVSAEKAMDHVDKRRRDAFKQATKA